MKIRYLGKQPKHRDRWFGAGVVWAPNEVHEVDDDTGRKLVEAWPELYADAGAQPVPVEIESSATVAPERPPIDLDKATRAEMADYGEVYLGEKLNRNAPRPELRDRLAALLESA